MNRARIAKQLDHLMARWRDEHDYENWGDYEASMRKVVEEEGGEMVCFIKRPAHVKYTVGDRTEVMKIQGNQIVNFLVA